MKNRSGSALLIVLGMLAFMVVSAVGFSAYMRYARLPSSFLRRSSSSRMLAKSALAKAIDIIDRSIGNAVHPGLGSSGDGVYQNNWAGRVYIGSSTSGTVDEDETIPVMTLEGLAYVPPPLINSVRHYSRRSAAALWQQFDDFEAGRYAFCAVDVSDYFDVNRMFAGVSRNSTPERRITLGHIFENDRHTSAGSGADEWDTFMENFREVDDDTSALDFKNKLPLVSLADFNLALGAQGTIGSLYSPFYRMVNGSGETKVTESSYETLRRMTFVTDGWYPLEKSTYSTGAEVNDNDIYDLTDKDDQPFDFGGGGPKAKSTMTLEQLINPSRESAQYLRNHISSLGLAALYDYLDTDSIPISLAIPTTERVPMICAIEPKMSANGLKLTKEFVEEGDPKSGRGNSGLQRAEEGEYCIKEQTDKLHRTVCRTERYVLSGLADTVTGVTAGWVYPFAHEDDENDISFKIDGRISLFFTLDTDPMTTRAGTANESKNQQWALTKSDFANKVSTENGIITVPLTAKDISLPKNVKSQSEVIKEVQFDTKKLMTLSSNLADTPFVIYTREWQQERDDEDSQWHNVGDVGQNTAPITEVRYGIPPITSEGEVNTEYSECINNANGLSGRKVKLNLAIWLRVIGDGDDVYDMVPASVQNDKEFNGLTAGGPKGSTICENTFPVMRLDMGASYPLHPDELAESGDSGAANVDSEQLIASSSRALMIADPRFNYAPESWFKPDGGSLSPENWLSTVKPALNEGEGDLFMAVSDQGYMQSVYELGFIPRFSNLVDAGSGGSSMRGNCSKADDVYPNGISTFATSWNNTLNAHLMWRTFDPLDPSDATALRNLNIISGRHGTKINPYSDSTNVIMAAFINTPVDWRCASTNNVEEFEKMSTDTFNSKYAWNEYSSVTSQQLAYEDLERIVGNFMSNVRSYQNWEQAWDNMNWLGDYTSEDNAVLCDVNLDNSDAVLWGVDRKFLYGYWRECFAARQQLFLVFVRAEPLMIGGEGVDQASPQLSSRAVALVWRDPSASSGNGVINGYPHRTRVLFYRPLE